MRKQDGHVMNVVELSVFIKDTVLIAEKRKNNLLSILYLFPFGFS